MLHSMNAPLGHSGNKWLLLALSGKLMPHPAICPVPADPDPAATAKCGHFHLLLPLLAHSMSTGPPGGRHMVLLIPPRAYCVLWSPTCPLTLMAFSQSAGPFLSPPQCLTLPPAPSGTCYKAFCAKRFYQFRASLFGGP